MNFNSPKSEPKKSFEKLNAKKSEKDKIASKPDQKPYDKPKNKIEPRKIDPNKEPKHKIQCRKLDPNAPTRHKIEPRKINPKIEPKHKLHPRKIDPNTPPRHKIKPPKFDPKAPTRNKIEHPKIDLKAPTRNKIERPKIDLKAPPRNKIERPKIDLKAPSRNKIERPKIDLKAPSRNKIERPKFDPKAPPRNKIQQQFDTNKLDIDHTPSIQSKNNDISKLEEIKEKIKNFDWESISDDWNITTRSNQYAEYNNISLDPTKDVSKENPLYRNKEWLDKVYNSKNWKLNDKDIANLCGVHPSVIGKWRRKHHISRKLQGEGRWIDKRSGRTYIRVPQDYNHPELIKRPGSKSIYRLEHIYNIEKYLSQHPELKLSKEYLINGKYLRVGTRVKYINQDSKDNSVGNLRINKNTVEPIRKEVYLRSNKTSNRTATENSKKSSQKHSKNSQAERIIKREVSNKIHAKGYRARMTMPKDYDHPELSPNPDNRYIRQVHTVIMENYLAKNPNLELSKKYLIQDKYLRTGTEVHHINQIKTDNRITNLWIYENKKEHARGEQTIYDSLKSLVGTNQIVFKNGKYFLNPDIDPLKTNPSELGLERKGDININFKDINLVKEEIKKIDWNSISNHWSVQVKKNQFVQKTVKVDPTRSCSEDNPLHHHKEWLQRIVNDNRFNLTDSRLAKLCGITRDTARYWRDRMHGIKGKTEWGFERRVDDKDGRIWIKVPKNYANPVVQKEDHHRRIMLEHRYVIEQHLAKHPELEISKKCLINGKYLKSEAHVHHINLDYQDNRTENLWVFETDKNHKEATKSLYSLVKELLNSGKIRFKEGKYHTDT